MCFPSTRRSEAAARRGCSTHPPSLGSRSAERFFVTSIAAARERCSLSTGYFVPDRYLRRPLCEAAARGVDVRILTPGGNTDRSSTWYAARAHYPELLEAGVRIHEYRPTMMHAKTLVVDGICGMIGTLNFDNRSLVLNDEVGLLFHDRGLGGTLESAFRATSSTLTRCPSRGSSPGPAWETDSGRSLRSGCRGCCDGRQSAAAATYWVVCEAPKDAGYRGMRVQDGRCHGSPSGTTVACGARSAATASPSSSARTAPISSSRPRTASRP